MSSNNNPNNLFVQTELSLQKLREYIAGAIALIIVLGAGVLLFVALQGIGNVDQFQRAKDLLLIVSPFVGVVIGYYFNKVSADARASALERAVTNANEAAAVATADSQRADMQAQTAQTQADKARGALSEMVSAAENAGAGQPGKLGSLGGEESGAMNVEFLVALERAKRALNN